MKKLLITILLMFIVSFVFSQNAAEEAVKSEDNIMGAIYNNLEYELAVVDISNHNLYIRTPYFIIQDSSLEMFDREIALFLPNYLVIIYFTNDHSILEEYVDEIVIYNLHSKDGIKGLVDNVIQKHIIDFGYNPLTIKKKTGD
jgi:hypothetical protein